MQLNSMTYIPGAGAKARCSFPKGPRDVEVNNIKMHAGSLKCDLFIANANADIVEVQVADGGKRREVVQIFTESLRACSCDQYHRIGAGYCKHIAVLDIIAEGAVTIEERLFSKALIKNIKHLSDKKTIKYIVYDSLKGGNIALGDGPIEKKSLSCLSNERFLASIRAEYFDKVELESPYYVGAAELYDYQHNILEQMLSVKRAICSMVAGSGKTILSIAGIKHVASVDDLVLIVCPKSIIKQWSMEVKRLLGRDVQVLESDSIVDFKGGIGITTYQTMNKCIDTLSSKRYLMVIADEVQFVKNGDGKTWGALNRLSSEYFWGLSGTIIENRLDDLYYIMEIIRPGVLGPKWKFDYKFKVMDSIHRKKVLYKNELQKVDDLRELIKDNVFSYADIKLPDISYSKHFIEMDDASRAQHDYFVGEANKLISKSLNVALTGAEQLMIQSYLLKARQICNSVELVSKVLGSRSNKVSEVLKIIKDICVVGGEKLVIFSEWTEMLSILERELDKDFSVGHVRLDGSMSGLGRSKSVERFTRDGSCLVFFSSDAGGVGIDGLQLVCSNVLHVELPWNPGKLAQRNARLHRLKQTKPVKVHYLITNDSIEERMQKLLTDKDKIRADALF